MLFRPEDCECRGRVLRLLDAQGGLSQDLPALSIGASQPISLVTFSFGASVRYSSCAMIRTLASAVVISHPNIVPWLIAALVLIGVGTGLLLRRD